MKTNSKNNIEKEIVSDSTLAWIKNEGVKNEKGEPIEFNYHYFLLDVFTDKSRVIVIRKGSQVGVSTFAILKELHDAKYLGINQIHTLPSDKDVWEFVPTKVDRIIRANGITLDKDSTEIKGIGKGFVYYKGTFTEKAPIIISSDRNIYDEVDKSKIDIIGDYASRMAYSKMGEEIYISTPTIPDFGIDKLYNQSDQKHWRFDCPHCHYRQHMEWEKNVDLKRGIYICQKCQKEITPEQIRKLGKWEARFPGEPISGYWITQMMCWDAERIIREYNEAMEGVKGKDEKYFYNFILGLPYLSAEQKVEASLFLRNQTNKEPDRSGWNIMGVDTGKENHVIIGNEKAIFWMGVLKDKPNKTRWQQMEELIEFYSVRVAVVDAQPYTEDAQALANKFPYRVYLNFFKEDPKMLEVTRFGDEKKKRPENFDDEIKVFTSRNRIYDDTISALMRGEFTFAMPKESPTFQLLIKHAQTIYARTVTDKYGQEKREWANLGADHLWTALIYWHIALKKRLKYEPNR